METLTEGGRTRRRRLEREAALRSRRIAAAPLALIGLVLLAAQITSAQPVPVLVLVGLGLTVPLLATFKFTL